MAKAINDPVELGLGFGLQPYELLMNNDHAHEIKMVLSHKLGRILIPEHNFQCEFNDKHNGHTALVELYDQGMMNRKLLFAYHQMLFKSPLPEVINDGEMKVTINDVLIDYRHS
ncbi:hypothetical protein IPM19_01870 [bacterium]|nr:MAG: hypothetical protein IPM19_01870 [bacterium]